MKKKIYKLLIYIVLYNIGVSLPLLAGGNYFMVTDVGTSAKMIRLGNMEGFSECANTVFENPASIYQTKSFSTSAFTTNFMNEVEYINGAATLRLPLGVIGAGYMSAGVNDIPKTTETVYADYGNGNVDSEFQQIGSFSYSNTIGKVIYQISQNENLHFGLGATYYQTQLDTYQGKGINFDAGLVMNAEPLSLSVSLKNISKNLKINYNNSESETLPMYSTYTARYRLWDLNCYGQIKTIGENKESLKAFGIEYIPSLLPFISLAGGYKEYLVIREVKYNVTLGLGLKIFGLHLDYAYEQSEHYEFNHKHYFSVGLTY